jgi:hypothetical protein
MDPRPSERAATVFRHPSAPDALRTLLAISGGEPLWAVLDGAQDPRIWSSVQYGTSPWGCLYAGRLARPLQEVAPYLVRMLPERPDALRLLENGWERNWGVFAVAVAPLSDLRRHLRRHLRVRTEAGKTLLLRWYDPRVLRIYLPTCFAGELKEFFGPVRAFIAEAPQRGQVQVFTAANGKLRVETVPLIARP